jgi:myosin heavy subunit
MGFDYFIFMMQAIYDLEGVPWTSVSFPDNAEVLTLIEGFPSFDTLEENMNASNEGMDASEVIACTRNRNRYRNCGSITGILALLDDECKLSRGSDQSLARKLVISYVPR